VSLKYFEIKLSMLLLGESGILWKQAVYVTTLEA